MSFKIDSLRLRTISDFQYDSPYVLDDVYEGVMVKGPIVYISGSLHNDSEKGIIIYASSHSVSDYKPIAHIEFNTIFDYRGQRYETEQEEVLYDFNVLPAFPLTKYRSFRQTIADNEEICILYLGPGESVENKFHGAVVGAENLVVNFGIGNARSERLGDDEIVKAPSGIALARPETV